MVRIAIALFAILALTGAAEAQTPATVRLCAGAQPNCALISGTNPLPTTAVITPSGTQDVNITKILGAAPSATNPLWVSPATASTPWAVSAASGAFASGSLASGAVADLIALSAPITPATATGTKSFLLGMQYNSTQATFTNAQQGAVQGTSRGALYVATGADTFTVTSSTSTSSPELTPVAPATATATKGVLLGAQATTAAVNPTNGQQGALSSDTNNNLLVSAGGAPNLAIVQVSIATSDTLAIAARALRRSVTIQQITGTQNVFCNQTTATAANGIVLPAVVGASITLNTTSAVRCIAITGAQTVAIAETY